MGSQTNTNEQPIKEDNLFNSIKDVDSALIEQYKLYVGTANQTSTTRVQANTFFLTLNTLLVGFIVSMTQFVKQPAVPLWMILVCIIGIFLTITWFVLIRAYRDLNSARFQIIQEIETKLPLNLYRREWQIALEERPKRVYIRQTTIEQMVPYAFGVLYIVLALSLLLLGA
jgi:hypothetical protein